MTYAEVLIRKGKRGAAAYVQAECNSAKTEPSKSPQHLNALLDHLLHPEKNIDDQDTIDWCRWLVGGGRSYEDFAAIVREYDDTERCGLVWTADFVAFRCRTCGISQCMSLCSDCFKDGNHEGHDFNWFKSQAGGACDCGDSSVMKESGFCSQHHGCSAPKKAAKPPPDLMCVAENMIPRIILRLIQHLRVNAVTSRSTQDTAAEVLKQYERTIRNADRFLKLLHDFSSLGTVMRTVLAKCLIDPQSYQQLTNVNDDSEYANFMRRSKEIYEDAQQSLPNLDPPTEFQDCAALTATLKHNTFLEELVFWTVKYEFPEKLVCLQLKILPDAEYKEAFTRSFVKHYSRVCMMLMQSCTADKLSNRIVHVSVQLFSNEELALAMTDQLSLLHIMVSSLKNIMLEVLIPCALHDETTNRHMVVDCAKHIIHEHRYWPLVSDLNNVLNHPPIAFRFMANDGLLTMWFDFLKMFQGMNLNRQITGAHIEYEPQTYFASFTAELEGSASPMWALVSHLKDEHTRNYTLNVIKHCLTALKEWMEAMNFNSPDIPDYDKVSFHFPLHRYLSLFIRQGVEHQGFALTELLPDPETLTLLMQHPIRCQAAFYEIMCGLWVRNGLQIKGQAMTYIQCHFCNSMSDADISFLQHCATHLESRTFLGMFLDRFKVKEWLSLSPGPPRSQQNETTRRYRDQEQEVQMAESALIFLVSILSTRTNLGLDVETLTRVELTSLLCRGGDKNHSEDDRTHSMLFGEMPEKCGNKVPVSLFDSILSQTATYCEPRFEPSSGNMLQGHYLPKPFVWEQHYDPIHVLLRAVHRREFQTSIERFSNFAKERYENDQDRLETVNSPWPPWRIPMATQKLFQDPRKLLHSRFCHGLIFNLLYKSLYGPLTNDTITSLAVHLLELAVTYPQTDFSGKEVAVSQPWLMVHEPIDLKFDTWYPTDYLSANIRHNVSAIFSRPAESPAVRHRRTNPTNQQRGLVNSNEDGIVTAAPTQRMDIDDDDTNAYQVETVEEDGVDYDALREPIAYNAPLAITGPAYTGPRDVVPADGEVQRFMSFAETSVVGIELVPTRRRQHQTSQSELLPGSSDGSGQLGLEGQPSSDSDDGQLPKRAVINVNESIVTLMLRLHSKYSGRPDSYVPLSERKGFSTTLEYRDSRIGDGCFFIEKVLDRICELDQECAENVASSRKKLWPHYHEDEAKRDAERERLEAEAKKKKAKERQRQMMEQLAQQRRRFMQSSQMSASALLEDIGDTEKAEKASKKKAEKAATEGGSNDETLPPTEYTCCHCLMQTPANEERPIGLVTLIQSTSVLAHKHESTNHLVLPTSEEEENALPPPCIDSLGLQYEELFAEMNQVFDAKSCLLSVHRGWKGGIHIQSCGHHMHYDCRSSYCDTLRQQMRPSRDHTLDFDRGEFSCPACRQMANSLLPVPPDAPPFPLSVSSQSLRQTSTTIHSLLGEETLHMSPGPTPLRSEMSKIMEVFTKSTLPQYRLEGNANPSQVVTMFISSIARTNLETDIVQRGGSLVCDTGFAADISGASSASSLSSSSSGAIPKPSKVVFDNNKTKFCFVPLMHVLAIHMKVMAPRSLAEVWGSLTGQWTNMDNNGKLIVRHNNVPLLMQDPLTLMTHFILLLPINIDIGYFVTIARACYNLQVAQTLVRIACTLSMTERSLLRSEYLRSRTLPDAGLRKSLSIMLGEVVDCLEETNLFSEEEDVIEMADNDASAPHVDMAALETEAQRLVLPFLRIAALIKHYVYKQILPEIRQDDQEFSGLIAFLGLAIEDATPATTATALSSSKHPVSFSVAPDESSCEKMDETSCHPTTDSDMRNPCDGLFADTIESFTINSTEVKMWCSEFATVACADHLDVARQAMRVNVLWKQPTLLKLHNSFDHLFQYYHKRVCTNCNKVPKDASVCLLCGTIVCLKEACCKQIGPNGVALGETVKHAQDCGGGTGIYLAVNSSTIVIVRGKRACIWGTVFLDVFGEEDRELKRGKPLFLHQVRYKLLENQWLTHKFDHTNKRWVPHRDSI